MKTAAFVLALVCCAVPRLAAAQGVGTCDACISEADCDDRHASCVAECRARLFGIDPKRAACIADCSSKASQCSQTATVACRTRNLCR